MILQVADVLDRVRLAAVREALATEAVWQDGIATAKGRTKSVKRNLQARGADPVKGSLELIATTLRSHPTISAASIPDCFTGLMFNRYDAGMRYGPHVDAPYIDGVRTDISFTLFLSDPETYEGGALVIESAGAEDAIKLPAGALVLYPSTFVHRVEEVTRGSRLAAVGWIKSRVRSAEHRATIFDLEAALADLATAGVAGEVHDRLSNLRNNLLRVFGE